MSPVLVVPQVCIGAIGKFQIIPRYSSVDPHGSGDVSADDIYAGRAVVAPHTIMNVSWTADHRVIDGATVARFSTLWKQFLESPYTMLSRMV